MTRTLSFWLLRLVYTWLAASRTTPTTPFATIGVPRGHTRLIGVEARLDCVDPAPELSFPSVECKSPFEAEYACIACGRGHRHIVLSLNRIKILCAKDRPGITLSGGQRAGGRARWRESPVNSGFLRAGRVRDRHVPPEALPRPAHKNVYGPVKRPPFFLEPNSLRECFLVMSGGFPPCLRERLYPSQVRQPRPLARYTTPGASSFQRNVSGCCAASRERVNLESRIDSAKRLNG